MVTRKRKSRNQEEAEEEDDCFQMQQKIVDLLREKVHRLEYELNYLRSHQSLLYRAWSMPIYPPEYKPGLWIPPRVRPEQVSLEAEQPHMSNGAGQYAWDPELTGGKTKRMKTQKSGPVAPTLSSEKEPVVVQESEDCDSDASSDSRESDDDGSPMVETVTTESAVTPESSSSEDNSSDEEGEKGNSSGSESEGQSSSDSDDDKTPVTPAIGETKTHSHFPRVNWANEPRRKRASRPRSTSDSGANDSDDSVSSVEVADEEVISQPGVQKEEFETSPVEDCGNTNSVASGKNKKCVPKKGSGSEEKVGEAKVKKKKKGAKLSDSVNAPSAAKVDILSPNATPEDIFDWNVLGLPGPWTQPKPSSFTHWHGSSDDSPQWPKQLTSLPCRFSSYDEYMTRNQWLVFEECKAFLDSSWEIMQKRDGPGRDTSVSPDAMEDNLESRKFQFSPMHRCADDSFSYFEVEALDGRRFHLDTSEILLLSFRKFPEMQVLASVSSKGDKSVLLKTRVDLQSYGSQCKLARMSNMVTLKRQFIALVNVPNIWHPLRQSLLDPLTITGCTVSPPSDDCLDEDVRLPADLSNTLLTWKEHGIFNNRQLLTMAALLQMKQGFLLVQGNSRLHLGLNSVTSLSCIHNLNWYQMLYLGTCHQTSTIVGMISALCIEEPGAKILVCAASNAAVDEIVSRLIHTMLDKDGKLYSPKLGTLIRVGVQKSVQVACHPVTMDSLLARCSKGTRATARTQMLCEASVICSTLSGSGHSVFDESNQKFDLLVIDEAAQALECETLIALQRGKGRCVIVGDPCQLPATVIQRPGTAYGRSLFERMQQAGLQTFLMTTQYRMHPEVSKYPSARFYHGCLMNSKSTQSMQSIFSQDACDSGLNCDGYSFKLGPYCFLDVSWGEEELEATGHSLSNVEEAAVVATVVNGVVKSLKDGRKADIGVITPYLAQRSTIMTSLLKYKIDEGVCEVNTVDGFQGREKDVIILSCVRAVTDKGLGFVSDEKRMNVALTRAKYALIIVGHGKTLKSQSASWNALLEDAHSRGCYQLLRSGGASKRSDKSSAGEETVPAVSEKAAKFHSAQTSPVKKPQYRPNKSSVPATVKAEPATYDSAHRLPECSYDQLNGGQHSEPMDTVKRMRGAVRINGPAHNQGGGAFRGGRSTSTNGTFPASMGFPSPNQHIYFGSSPGEHQQVFRHPPPSYNGRHIPEAHEHHMNHSGHWHNHPGNVNQGQPFYSPRGNRGRR